MNDLTSTPDEMAVKPCDWAIATNESSRAFGVTVGGEFSTAINNCGLWYVVLSYTLRPFLNVPIG